jgi:hypothetical protein
MFRDNSKRTMVYSTMRVKKTSLATLKLRLKLIVLPLEE